jgi:hypothetical protein
MENIKYITEFIWSIVGICIIVFLFHNRKPLANFITSVSRLIDEVDVLKWGKRGELKRRQLEEVAKAMESDSSLMFQSSSGQRSSSSSSSSTSTEEHNKQLENKIEVLNKQLAGTATVAVSTAGQYIPAERLAYFEKIRDQALKDVTTSDADSPIVKSALPLTRECATFARFKKLYVDDSFGKCLKNLDAIDIHYSNSFCDDWVSHPKSLK